jgi:hypothetical protein
LRLLGIKLRLMHYVSFTMPCTILTSCIKSKRNVKINARFRVSFPKLLTCFQCMLLMRSSLFWVITQLMLVAVHQRVETAYSSPKRRESAVQCTLGINSEKLDLINTAVEA